MIIVADAFSAAAVMYAAIALMLPPPLPPRFSLPLLLPLILMLFLAFMLIRQLDVDSRHFLFR